MRRSDNAQSHHILLPRWSLALTGAIAILVCVASSLGLFVQQTYAKESESWIMQAKGQDIANLISIPLLIGSAFLVS